MFAGWSVGCVLRLRGFRAPRISYQSRWIAKVCKLRKPDSNESKCRISGFFLLPPQGENWCVRSMASQGFTFFKYPGSVEIPAKPPTPNDLFHVVLQTVRFMGIATALPEFGTHHPSPDQLKVVVDDLISNHFFAQVVGGISSAERHFQLVDSHSATDGSFGASCIRFDAYV